MAEYDLVKKAIKDPSVFRTLYDRYFEVMFRFIYRRIDDEDRTADITSQVFYKALKNLGKYKFKGVPFSAWLYKIAANEVSAFYRLSKKRSLFSLEEELIKDIVEENIEEGLDMEELKLAMDKLTEREAEILELRFFEEKPFAEVAYILDISEANAKMRTYRALEKLRNHIMVKEK